MKWMLVSKSDKKKIVELNKVQKLVNENMVA